MLSWWCAGSTVNLQYSTCHLQWTVGTHCLVGQTDSLLTPYLMPEAQLCVPVLASSYMCVQIS